MAVRGWDHFVRGRWAEPGEDVYDCTLTAGALRRLWKGMGPFEVDCCATPGAVQQDPYTGAELDFVSPFGEGATWTEVMSLQHEGRLYAFPPVPLIGKLVAHVKRNNVRMVMVVPDWPTSSWSAVARDACIDLGTVADVVRPGGAGLPPPPPPFGRGFAIEEAVAFKSWQSLLIYFERLRHGRPLMYRKGGSTQSREADNHGESTRIRLHDT